MGGFLSDRRRETRTPRPVRHRGEGRCNMPIRDGGSDRNGQGLGEAKPRRPVDHRWRLIGPSGRIRRRTWTGRCDLSDDPRIAPRQRRDAPGRGTRGAGRDSDGIRSRTGRSRGGGRRTGQRSPRSSCRQLTILPVRGVGKRKAVDVDGSAGPARPVRRTSSRRSPLAGVQDASVSKRSTSRVPPRLEFSASTASRKSSRPMEPRFRSMPKARIETSRFSASRGPTTAR
jgi:hypothetical protein